MPSVSYEISNADYDVVLANALKQQPKMARQPSVKPGRCWIMKPGGFCMKNHYYARALVAKQHKVLGSFLDLTAEQVVKQHAQLHPEVKTDKLQEVLAYVPRHFFWGGCDLFNVTDGTQRHMMLVETNSMASGQKSVPAAELLPSATNYHRLISETFAPMTCRREASLPPGVLAVIYDKNEMEASGYASAIADVMGEPCYFVEWKNGDVDPPVRWTHGVLEIKASRVQENEMPDLLGEWIPVRAAFRYVTQSAWNRIPIVTKTFLFNGVIACLAGGRNKYAASLAYAQLNAELEGSGLAIRTPETIMGVSLEDVPELVRSWKYCAVIKNPCSSCGQGVYTITCKEELKRFSAIKHDCACFIVQSLVGNVNQGRFHHTGTLPDEQGSRYVMDCRMVLAATASGYRPFACYARRARSPLGESLDMEDSWSMLGTNLSVKTEDGLVTETARLMLLDSDAFDVLNLSLDSLLDGFVQACLAAMAIDRMACRLLTDETFSCAEFARRSDLLKEAEAVSVALCSS